MVLEHSLHIQMLHGCRLVFTGKPRGAFVQEIFADIRYPLVDAGEAHTRLAPVLRPGQLAGQPALLAL